MPKKEDQPVESTKKQSETVKSTPPWPLITIGIFISVIMFAILAAGWGLLAAHHFGEIRHEKSFGRMHEGRGEAPFFRHPDVRGRHASATFGVVTAVDNDNFTVSGNGKQVKVNRDDSMIVRGTKTEIAVNDSVVVFGNKDDSGTITATRVLVINQEEEQSSGRPKL